MKKLLTGLTTIIAMTAFATAAFAAGSLTGKVTNIDVDKVTVAVEGAVPAWTKAGAKVSAAGGAPTVISVKGNDVTLKFSKAKAAKIKINSNMKIAEPSDDAMQGC